MASKQFFKFVKGQIIKINDCGLSLYDIAKELIPQHSIEVSSKIIRKLEIIIKKKVVATREKKPTPPNANQYPIKY